MLGNLLKYEMIKSWKSFKYVLLVFGLVELTILFISRTFFWNGNVTQFFNEGYQSSQDLRPFFAICMFIYFLASVGLLIFPFFQSIHKYERDLSGKQAVLELMIPAPSWKKVVAKLIITVCATIICGMISFISVVIFILVMTNFYKEFGQIISKIFEEIGKAPGRTIFIIMEGFFNFASMYLLFFFCVAISKWITHKNKASGLISIGVFIISIIVIAYLQRQALKVPITTYTLFGMRSTISSALVDILVFVLTFASTSWIMEKKIEV